MCSAQISNDFPYVNVKAAARLHFGFFDMHGGFDRKFGSLGLCISDIDTMLVAEYADDINITGPSSERAADFAEQILSHFGINGGVKMEIKSAIPEHFGLGSGTQLSLATASAVTRLYGLSVTPASLAAILHRGARSGIGIGTFIKGGFIVDAGRGKDTEIPPVISHMPFPEHWRILLIFDNDTKSINGVSERSAFNRLPPMEADTAGLLCRLTMMQVLPAISEKKCDQFGAAITQIQNIMSDYFFSVQGSRYTSPFLETILSELQSAGATGCGQSSWGPTGFAFFPNDTCAFQALKQVRDNWKKEPRLRFAICKACNHEAKILVTNKRPVMNNEEIKDKYINTVQENIGK